MASELIQQRKAWSVLIVSTLAFTVCFMVWMMFGVIGVPIKKMLDLNATQFGLLMAMPVLTGSLVRVPLGIWTDRFGGRSVMALLMAATVLVNLMPTNPYSVTALTVWRQGHFLNFNGLTRLIAALWPYLTLTFLVWADRQHPRRN